MKATKYVHWRYNTQPDLTAQACDFGWCEMMEEMAYGCAQGFTPPGPQTSGAQADGAVKQFVEAVTTQCQQAIGQNGPHLEQLIGRFTGKSSDAPADRRSLLDMGLVRPPLRQSSPATSGGSRTRWGRSGRRER